MVCVSRRVPKSEYMRVLRGVLQQDEDPATSSTAHTLEGDVTFGFGALDGYGVTAPRPAERTDAARDGAEALAGPEYVFLLQPSQAKPSH